MSKNPPTKWRIGGAGRRCQAHGEGGQRDRVPKETECQTDSCVSELACVSGGIAFGVQPVVASRANWVRDSVAARGRGVVGGVG